MPNPTAVPSSQSSTEATWPPAGLAPPRSTKPLSDTEKVWWDRGIQRADNDLRKENARLILGHFLYSYHDIMFLDANTGLPGSPGYDAPSSEMLAADMAYDERVQQYIKVRGLPSNSRKQWLETISDPKRYFAQHLIGAVELRLGVPVRSPDGSSTVEMVHENNATLNTEVFNLRVVTPRTTSVSLLALEAVTSARVLWGPPGSRTIFVWMIDGPHHGATFNSYQVFGTEPASLLCRRTQEGKKIR